MISDSDLLLYHYGDGLDAAERERIRVALSAEPELDKRLRLLIQRLDAAAMIPDVAVPAHTRQRWQAAIEQAARNEAAPRRVLLNPSHWRVVGVVAAIVLVVSALIVTMKFTRDGEGTSRTPHIASNTTRPERALQWHLASAEQQLAELDATSGEERDRLIDTVIAQNRLYAIAAERSGDQRLARALRSFAPILERLAAAESGSNEPAAELAQLNFELRVMQARLAAEAATAPTADSLAL
jgi:hypothetical protein